MSTQMNPGRKAATTRKRKADLRQLNMELQAMVVEITEAIEAADYTHVAEHAAEAEAIVQSMRGRAFAAERNEDQE